MKELQPSELQDSDWIHVKESQLRDGDLVYTPQAVNGSGGKKHNVFEYDSRIIYSVHYGQELTFYKLKTK